jgi:hypothetical protein
VSDPLQSGKSQEAASALNGVNGSEDASQKTHILRVLFQLDQILIETREVFMTLDQELSNGFLIFQESVFHDPLPIPEPFASSPRSPRMVATFLFDCFLSAQSAEEFKGLKKECALLRGPPNEGTGP